LGFRPEGDTIHTQPTITDSDRRKIFALVKEAHEKTASPLPLDDFRQQHQQAVGIASLKDCPASFGLKLMNRLHRIIDEERTEQTEPTKRTERRTVRVEGQPCEGQLRKVFALLTDMSLSWEYADGMAARMYGQKRTEQLKPNELRGLIAALTKRQIKRGGRRTEVGGVHHG
jgi:hypothetical protein